MGLIDEIRDGAIDERTALSGVLRRCLILANRLGYDPLRDWANRELSGYQLKVEFPDYRIIRSSIHCQMWINGLLPHSYQEKELVLPSVSSVTKEMRDAIETLYIGDGVSQLETLDDSGRLKHQLEPEFLALVNHDLGSNACSAAWVPFPPGVFASVLSSVRTRVVNFMIELEQQFPDHDPMPNAITSQELQQVAEAFHHLVINVSGGGVANFNAGSGTFNAPHMTTNITVNDLDSLHRFLRSLGVDAENLEELNEIVAEDGVFRELKEDKGKLKRWVDRTAGAMVGAGKSLTFDAAKAVLIQALLDFSGLT